MGLFRAICNSSALVSLHCYSCMFPLSVCTFFIHCAFSLKSFSSLHIVSQNFSMSFIAGVSFTVPFSFPISLQNFFALFSKTTQQTFVGIQDVLKTYLEDVFKTSRRRTKFLLVISVSNKSKCLSNKSLFHKLYLGNLRRIQNASLRTQ